MNGIGYGNSMFLATHGILARSGGGGASLLLDTYTGAAVAYSLRQLRTAYTGAAIRVRRSSDNAEQDINFVGGNLDTASLLTFCGAGNGFITTWYDQSGNALNIVRAVATQQPKIVSSGVVEVKNLKSTITFDGTDDVLSYPSPISAINSGNEFSIYSVHHNNTTGTIKTFWTNSASGSNNQMRGFGDTRTTSPLNFFISNSASASFSSTLSTVRNNTDQRLQVSVMDSGNVMRGFDNGATGGTATYTLTYANAILQIGTGANGALNGGVQEFIIFDTNQLSNRTAIETNINDYYSIY